MFRSSVTLACDRNCRCRAGNRAMQPVIEHPWQLTPAEAAVLQNEPKKFMRTESSLPPCRGKDRMGVEVVKCTRFYPHPNPCRRARDARGGGRARIPKLRLITYCNADPMAPLPSQRLPADHLTPFAFIPPFTAKNNARWECGIAEQGRQLAQCCRPIGAES